MFGTFQSAVKAARRQGDLYFAALLDRECIAEAFGSAISTWDGWLYTPAVTVWVFLSQCLSADHSCREAVAKLVAWMSAQGQRPCSSKTGAYCTARDQLPEAACHRLMCCTGKEAEDQASEGMVVERASRARRGWFDHHHAGYGRESGGVSTIQIAAPRMRFPDRANRGGFFPGGRYGVGGGDRTISRQTDR